MAEEPEICLLCDKALTEDTKYEIKGPTLDSFINASIQRRDTRHLQMKSRPILIIHKNCSKNYTQRSKIEAHLRKLQREEENKKKELSHGTRSTFAANFDYENLCFICGKDASDAFIETQLRYTETQRNVVRVVRDSDVKKRILDKCQSIQSELSIEVSNRLERVDDLVLVGARYHDHCKKSFYNIPVESAEEKSDTAKIAEFISKHIIENKDECQFNIAEILEHYNGEKNYDIKYLKDHLHKIFKNEIIIHPSKYGHLISYVKESAKILTENWCKTRNRLSEEQEREKICKLAGKILFEDIRKTVYDNRTYPAPENFVDKVDDHIPRSLKLLLDEIISTNKRNPKEFESMIQTVAHILISANRPRSFLSPILIGLGAMLDKLYGSKELIQTLNAAGLCASYEEVRLFEASLLCHTGSEEKKEAYKDAYIQLVFDNADHQVRTLDGKNTFHVEGGIEILTPASAVPAGEPIPRLSKIPKSIVLGKFGKRNIERIDKVKAKAGMKNVEILDIQQLRSVDHRIKIHPTDYLWLLAKIKYPADFKGWNGYMETITKNKYYQTSKVQFLPFINNPPSEYDTLYTALLHAEFKRKLAGQEDIFVTFDQPQFQKGRQLLQVCRDRGELLNVHVRLGGLHLLFSFLGSTGFIMEGSGLRDVLSEIYAENSVDKMLNGHAYSRAIRGHTLIHLALGELIQSNFELTIEEDELLHKMLDDLDNTLENVKYEEFLKIYDKFTEQIEKIKERGATAQLWVLYYELVTLIKQFIEAERSSDWNLHLNTVTKMLPYFHASGHFKYAESAHIYVQDMHALKMEKTEREKFVEQGFFAVRRSEKYYCGIWPDMAIEQILMRCLKTRGGLTRGRGVSDAVLAKWIYNMPALATITEVIQKFYNVSFASSEQHVDARPSRIQRDYEDLNKLLVFFKSYDPFPNVDKITCITSGLEGTEKVNCHQALEIGEELMQNMLKFKTFGNLKFKRADRVVSMASVDCVKVDNKEITVNSNLIFQDIIVAMEGNNKLPSFFEFELAPYPLSIFHNGSLRKTQKYKLYESFTPSPDQAAIEDCIHVIDGGFLIHKITWPKDEKFNEILNVYVAYLKRYKPNSYVVFDGYPDDKTKSTKYEERQRRQTKFSPYINFELDMVPTVSQEKFFANEKNKRRFIDKLRIKLEEANFNTMQAAEDADTLIVTTAIKIATKEKPAVIVAEDIDILVLLSQQTVDDKNVYMLKPSKGSTAEELYSQDSCNYPEIKHLLGFMHAMCGCDTTSAMFKQGKNKIVQLLDNNIELMRKALVFNSPEASKEDIEEAGEKIVAALYSKKFKGSSLNKLRYLLFKSRVKTKSFTLASLPPTKAAAIQHFYRVYYQVQQWFGHTLNPVDWGWEISDGKLKPTYGPLQVVPPEFLKSISCQCKKGCGKRCSCVKRGIKCSEFCGSCNGQTCNNVPDILDNLDIDDLDDDLDAAENSNETIECIPNSVDEPEDDILESDGASSDEDEDREDNEIDEVQGEEKDSDSDNHLRRSKRPRLA